MHLQILLLCLHYTTGYGARGMVMEISETEHFGGEWLDQDKLNIDSRDAVLYHLPCRKTREN